MSSKPTEVIAVILHHHVQAGHEEQVLHHGSGKPVLVIGNRESFVNINSMDTACARGAAAAAEPLWQAGCRRFFVLGAPHTLMSKTPSGTAMATASVRDD